MDLADRASIRAAVDQVEKLHGRLDGAFNNGAVLQQPGPLDTTSDEDIDQQFAVNFRADWTAMTAEAALMRRNGGGAIVNTSSNGITPGGTATEMIDEWDAAAPGTAERIRASIPLGRLAEPREVAEVAACLLSDRASMVTGAIVPVDGGQGA